MPEFSVKKPLTIFCATIAILVLGFVAYFRMTPDLFPSMDFPYVIIMTTDPGASPETVEETITKPMEQSMATLEHIKTVTSTSSANYSLVMLEFEEDVNLDTIGVDIQQQISQLQAGWSDTVGTPYVLKLNPSMIPVEVAAVSMKGMDVTELSDFMESDLLPQLEGVNGVARITASGTIRQNLHVVISQEKIDALNKVIAQGVNAKLDRAAADLNAAKEKMTQALTQIDLGIDLGELALPEINPDTVTELMEKVDADLAALEERGSSLQYAIDMLTQVRDTLASGGFSPEELAEKSELEQKLKDLEGQIDTYETKIRNILASDLSKEEKEEAIREVRESGPYLRLVAERAAVQLQLTALRLHLDDLAPGEIEKLKQELRNSLAQADALIGEMVESLRDVQGKITDLSQLRQFLRDQTVGLTEGIRRYQQITENLSELGASAGELMEGLTSMMMAMVQIETGLSTIQSSRDSALAQADLNNILTMQTVSQILAAQNFSMPAGYVEQDGVNYMVSVGDEFFTEEELGGLLLADMGLDGVEPIYLRDVADVFITDNADSTYAKLNGDNGIMLSFEKQSNYATAEVCSGIQERFSELQAQHEGLQFFPLMDQGDYIYLIVNSILESLLSGALFSILILLLFLRDLRPTFITLCSIPISVLFAVVLMYFSGVSLNMLSLSGLSIAVGMLVDNSVVVIENIYRLRAKGANAVQAAVSGAKQVSGAIVASTLTTICVFLPIVFVEGLTRQLFTDLALTMGYALMASLIIALTLVPAMAAGMLKKDGAPKKDLMDGVYDRYRAAGTWALRHKPVILGGAALLLVLSAGLSLARGFTFMPEVDSNTVSATIQFDEETEMAQAMEITDQVLARVGEIEEVENVGAMMGSTSLMGGSGGTDTGVTVYVTLPEGASGAAVGKRIQSLCSDLPCEISCSSSMMDTSMLTGSGITVELYGTEMESLQQAAATVAETLRQTPGTTEVSDGLEESTMALHVEIDRNKAMEKGYTIAQVYMQLAADMTQSATATSFVLDGSSIDVIVETPEQSRMTAENLLDEVFVQTGLDGSTSEFKLSEIAEVEQTVSMNSISRIDQKRYLSVTAGIAEGYNVTKVTGQVQQAMEQVRLPEGVRYQFAGENETIMQSLKQLIGMLLLGLMLVYFVMVAQFQSLKSPFIVMFTIPLAFTGGFLALLLTGLEVSIISMVGFIMLMGIIVNNGIVLVDYINQLRLEGWSRQEAILEAGVTRIRPILMTSLTTILGLFVMALGKDAGTALMQPMAVVCIGGLLYATLMTLFVVPCIYDIMNKKELRRVDEADLVILED